MGLITRFDASRFRSRIGGEITNFSTEGYIEPKEVKKFDRFVQYAYVSGLDAVRDSGLDFSKEDTWRCGVILGSGIGGLETIEVQHQRLLDKGPDKVSAFTIPKLIGNAASAQAFHTVRLARAEPGNSHRLRQRDQRHGRRL